MAQEKYVGDRNLTGLAIQLARELAKIGAPVHLTGSVAGAAMDRKKRPNDIDLYIAAPFEEWGDRVREIAVKFGFKRNDGYRKKCYGWQNIDQFVRREGGGNGKTTRDVWLDVFFHPMLLNPYLKKKIDEGLLLVKVGLDGSKLVLTASRITGGEPIKGAA